MHTRFCKFLCLVSETLRALHQVYTDDHFAIVNVWQKQLTVIGTTLTNC